VEAGLDAVLEGRTAIIVAHRLSTAMRADRIAVVDDGRIVELGPHDELIAKGGRYAEMFEAWTAHLAGHPNGEGGDGHEVLETAPTR
jgi:ATP-binding cassette subfamily B protein